MDFQTFKDTLHCRKIWIKVSDLELHRAHLEGPAILLFLIFSAVSNLLCINNQMKEFTLGIQSDCQTFFCIISVVDDSEDNFLYPSLTVYVPFFPQLRVSFEDLLIGAFPCRVVRRKFFASSKCSGG